ncbi:MAG: hypothetical protein V1754_04630 [Pseudomonadota bacterium]
MKKLLSVLFSAVLLCACGSDTVPPQPDAGPAPKTIGEPCKWNTDCADSAPWCCPNADPKCSNEYKYCTRSCDGLEDKTTCAAGAPENTYPACGLTMQGGSKVWCFFVCKYVTSGGKTTDYDCPSGLSCGALQTQKDGSKSASCIVQ